MCKKYGIEIITSTPTFEFWYMLHYKYTTKNYESSENLKKEIKKKIPNYSENVNVYPLIRKNTNKAINNAIKAERYHKELGKDIDSEEANPHTRVYKVVQELIKRNKAHID